MAKRNSRAKAGKIKSKGAKRHMKARKKSVKRAVGKKSKETPKKVAAKASGKRVTRSKRVTRPRQERTAAVETTVIDVVDEPIPGVVRVTEVEERRVDLPDPDAPTSRDIPEPDSLGG
jgi:hypothetical protein